MSDISNSTSSITVKAHLRDEIRRFSLPLTPFPTFASLSSLIKKIFSDAERGFVMKYRDDEGDLVTVASDADLSEALASLSGPRVLLRLMLELAPSTSPSSPSSSTIADSVPSPDQDSSTIRTSSPAPVSADSSSYSASEKSAAPKRWTVLYNGKPYVPQGLYKPDPSSLLDPKKAPSTPCPAASSPAPVPVSTETPPLTTSPAASPSTSSENEVCPPERSVAALSASTAAMVRALAASTTRDTLAHADVSAAHTLESSSSVLRDTSYVADTNCSAEIATLVRELSERTREVGHALASATVDLVQPLVQSTLDAQLSVSDAVRNQLQREVENITTLLAATTV